MIVVAFSGGKDSTAMALRMAELGQVFTLLNTPTGNELPEVEKHIEKVVDATGKNLIRPPCPTLAELIDRWDCLPNYRMRWCTRVIKIDSCAEWMRVHPDVELAVGLRADEEGRTGATYDNPTHYPLRDWGWKEADVISYCESRSMLPPKRTDCAVCFYQTLYEWWSLWKNYPEMYAQGETWERRIGHTFRSPKRDSRPAALCDLRLEFENGYEPKERKRKTGCRVCSM